MNDEYVFFGEGGLPIDCQLDRGWDSAKKIRKNTQKMFPRGAAAVAAAAAAAAVGVVFALVATSALACYTDNFTIMYEWRHPRE